MKERGEIKGARDQGRRIKVLTWKLQKVRSFPSIARVQPQWIKGNLKWGRCGEEKLIYFEI